MMFTAIYGMVGSARPVFTFLIQLSYQVLRESQLAGIWQEQTWILLLEYTPFYGILIWEYLDRRRI
jgi:hypothetical protein